MMEVFLTYLFFPLYNSVNAAYSFKCEDKDVYIQRSHILKQALELCSILQFEFIFTPVRIKYFLISSRAFNLYV